MSFSVYRELIERHFGIFCLAVMVIAFLVNHYLSSKTLMIAKGKGLFAAVNNRSSHSHPTVALGGVPIFVVIMLLLLLVIGSGFDPAVGFILAACFILFVIGLKDDLLGASARTKFAIQLAACFLFVINPDFALGHLDHFLGIELINPNWTYFIGLVFLLSVINAFNLIDGIDGLSAMTAIVGFTVFGVYFYFNDHYIYTIFCVTLIGALASFLTFNFAKPGKKMFLGDTGALVLGFLLGAFSLRVLELQPINGFIGFFPTSAPLFILCVLIVPVLDTSRVIVIRLLEGKKPWYADRSHMHHVLLDLGYTHMEATFRLIALQVAAVLGFLVVEGVGQVALHFYLLALYLSIAALFMILKTKTEVNHHANTTVNEYIKVS